MGVVSWVPLSGIVPGILLLGMGVEKSHDLPHCLSLFSLFSFQTTTTDNNQPSLTMESTNQRFARHRLLPPRLFIWLLIWRPTPTMGIYARYATYYTTFGCSFGDSLLHYGRTNHGDLSDNYPTLPTSPRVFIPSNNYPLAQLQLHTYRPTDPPSDTPVLPPSDPPFLPSLPSMTDPPILPPSDPPILRLSGRASHSEMVDPTNLTVGKAIHSMKVRQCIGITQ